MVKFRRQDVQRWRRALAGAAVLCVTALLAGIQCTPTYIGIAQLRRELRFNIFYRVGVKASPAPPALNWATASWTNPTDFLLKCERLEPPRSPQPTALKAPLHGNGTTLWNRTTVGTELGLGLALSDQPRDIGSVVSTLHALTNVAEACVHKRPECPAPTNHTCVLNITMDGEPLPPPPPARIGVLMLASGNEEYVRLSRANKRGYAAKLGYGVHIHEPCDPSRHPSWNKVPWALSLFHMYDWIWLIDADTLIMNSSIPLTDYIDSDYHAVITKDCNGVNFGSVLIRCSEWTEALLINMYTRPNAAPKHWWEQSAFMEICREAEEVCAGNWIKFLDNKGLNSYGSDAAVCSGAYSPGDLVVHFPSLGNKRNGVFREFWQQLSEADRTDYEAFLE